jgi:hypothetical protein
LDPSWISLEVTTCLCIPLQDPTTGQTSSIWCRLCQLIARLLCQRSINEANRSEFRREFCCIA